MPEDNLFTGTYLDRRAEARRRADWLVEARSDVRTLYVGMRGGAALVRRPREAGLSRLAFLTNQDPRVADDPESAVLLGWYEERRVVMVELPENAATLEEAEDFAELRPLVAELPASEAGLAAYARAMHLWRTNHRYCSRCGQRMVSERAGHMRTCRHCGYHSFPRLDPAIIVLAHAGDRALLGRQASWVPGRYSTIAGFVEPGESLEDAVRRELLEETGIVARATHYHSSQPWPFPSSLMLGFTAEAVLAEPVLHDGELEDARWFTRDELMSGKYSLPPREAISRRLIDEWLAAGD